MREVRKKRVYYASDTEYLFVRMKSSLTGDTESGVIREALRRYAEQDREGTSVSHGKKKTHSRAAV